MEKQDFERAVLHFVATVEARPDYAEAQTLLLQCLEKVNVGKSIK
jgi:hypothetical protein